MSVNSSSPCRADIHSTALREKYAAGIRLPRFIAARKEDPPASKKQCLALEAACQVNVE